MSEKQTIPSLNAALAIALEREKTLLEQLEFHEGAVKQQNEDYKDVCDKLENLTNFLVKSIKLGYLKITK